MNIRGKFLLKLVALAILTSIIFACSDSSDPIKEETKNWTVEKFYQEASTALHKQSYSRAVKLYNALEAAYPDGSYARLGLLDLAYAYYQNDQSDLAISTLGRFTSTYPTDKHMDYALYLQGYIDYKNDNGILSNFTGQDMSERDPKNLQLSYQAFSQLIKQYPNSKYTADAKDKINRLVYAMARAELYKARYYMGIKAYLAAIGRAEQIIANYPNTPTVEEALAIQAQAYQLLGQPGLSQDIKQILAINFPGSQYLTKAWHNQDIAWYAFWRKAQ